MKYTVWTDVKILFLVKEQGLKLQIPRQYIFTLKRFEEGLRQFSFEQGYLCLYQQGSFSIQTAGLGYIQILTTMPLNKVSVYSTYLVIITLGRLCTFPPVQCILRSTLINDFYEKALPLTVFFSTFVRYIQVSVVLQSYIYKGNCIGIMICIYVI